ncbi:MAG: hypothetical protein D6B25_02470 [Desulfobulbaceae bacterium]|nr:MAG: hypothetical protein D6B25_02470 [Desulfobulbaceae bacterium]
MTRTKCWLQKLLNKNIYLYAAAICYVLLAINALITRLPETPPYFIVLSDLHLSSAAGRFQKNSEHYFKLINEFKTFKPRPEFIFIVGDIIDNVEVGADGSLRGGSIENFQAEVQLFRKSMKMMPETPFYTTLGSGHDYSSIVDLETAEKQIGPRRGSIDWHGMKLVWFTVRRATFGENSNEPALLKVDYQWLDNTLSDSAQPVILISHVPFRTPITFEKGRKRHNRNYTIPDEDQLYQILRHHKHRIKALFHGHIHRTIATQLYQIPLYINPFLLESGYTKVSLVDNRELEVSQKHFN